MKHKVLFTHKAMIQRLVKNLRQEEGYKFIPMLMLTTESAGDMKMQGKQAGATGWIVKPFNPDQLLSTIKRVLG